MDSIADSRLGTPFALDELSSDERKQARQIADATIALLIKGLFHRVQPDRYRITNNHDSEEYRVAAAVSAIPSQWFDRMRPRIEAIRSNPAKTADLLGSFAHLDIRSSGLDDLIQHVAPHLVRITTAHPDPLNLEGLENFLPLSSFRHALVEPGSDDQGDAGALTQALTAIVDAAAGFDGEQRIIVAALIPVLGLVQSIFFDDKYPHGFAGAAGTCTV